MCKGLEEERRLGFKTEKGTAQTECSAGSRVSLVIVGRNLDFLLRVLGGHDGTKRRDCMARVYCVQ